jgi:hypothetical protein
MIRPFVMPGLHSGTHAVLPTLVQFVDCRVKPGNYSRAGS